MLADIAGAGGITVHLRGDRRHIQDEDVRALRSIVKTHLNLEMAATQEMIEFARDVKPNTATLVPERADEVTTEGGLDVLAHEEEIRAATAKLSESGILVSIFLDPVPAQIEAARRVGARQIEICTARYAELTDPTTSSGESDIGDELERIASCARQAGGLGLQVAAGHGLTYRNVRAVATLEPIEELNIGHNIVARAALVGMERAVREMIEAIG